MEPRGGYRALARRPPPPQLQEVEEVDITGPTLITKRRRLEDGVAVVTSGSHPVAEVMDIEARVPSGPDPRKMLLELMDMREKAVWESRLRKLRGFNQQNGRLPKDVCNDITERSLAVWLNAQILKGQRSELTPVQLEQLQEIPGVVKRLAAKTAIPKRRVPDKKAPTAIETRCGELRAFFESEGRLPKIFAPNLRERSLATWVNWAVHALKMKHVSLHLFDSIRDVSELATRLHLVPPARRLGKPFKIENIDVPPPPRPAPTWRVHDKDIKAGSAEKRDCFQLRCEQLMKFQEEFGQLPERFATDADEAFLGSWLSDSVSKARMQRLELPNLKILMSVPLALQALMHGSFEQEGKRGTFLMKRPAGDTPVWAHGPHRKSQLTRETLARVDELRAFVDQYGRLPRQKAKSSTEVKLAHWNRNRIYDARLNRIDPDLLRLLDEIPLLKPRLIRSLNDGRGGPRKIVTSMVLRGRSRGRGRGRGGGRSRHTSGGDGDAGGGSKAKGDVIPQEDGPPLCRRKPRLRNGTVVQSFEESMATLKEFINVSGRLPAHGADDAEEVKLAKWLSDRTGEIRRKLAIPWKERLLLSVPLVRERMELRASGNFSSRIRNGAQGAIAKSSSAEFAYLGE